MAAFCKDAMIYYEVIRSIGLSLAIGILVVAFDLTELILSFYTEQPFLLSTKIMPTILVRSAHGSHYYTIIITRRCYNQNSCFI